MAPASRRASPWVASTYFAQGLPYSIVHQMSAELFTALGASLSSIGLTSLYGLAWNAKFLWSPFVDRVGTTRRWIVLTEVALAAAVALVAWPASRADLGAVARVLVAVSVLAATHDIAIDGFYIRALGDRDQAALSGLRVAAYRAALFVGKSALVALAGATSWRLGFLLAAALLAGLSALHARALPRPQEGDARPVDASGDRVERRAAPPPAYAGPERRKLGFVRAFSTFLGQPGIAASLPFIILYKAGDALLFAMNAPMLSSLGLETATRGVLNGAATGASIAGSMLGGVLVARAGLRRTLFPIAALQSAAILLYLWLAAARPASLVLIGAVAVAEQLFAGIGTAAFVVFLMRRCVGEYKASHFAIATALMSIATTVAGSVSGYLAGHLGFPAFFGLAFAISVPGVLLTRFVPSDDEA